VKTNWVGVAMMVGLAAPGGAQTPAPESSPGYLDRARRALEEVDRERTLAQVRRLYQLAGEAGEKVPSDLYEWVRADMARRGDWEYSVVTASPRDPQALEKMLNDRGRERWECVGISPAGTRILILLKRPIHSYLSQLEVADVLRILPTP